MINIVSNKNVMNNKIISKEEIELYLNEESAKIYEVIRVIEGRPIFLKEHFDRMNESIRLSGIMGSLNYDDFKSSTNLLIKENLFKNQNNQSDNFFLMAGPCVVESEELVLSVAEKVATICQKLDIPIFLKLLIIKPIELVVILLLVLAMKKP